MLDVPNITAAQVTDALLAIPAFLPLTVCTGYLAAWFTNLHGFRQRSFIERIFWSIPLSIAISTITSVLIARFFSLRAVSVIFLVSAVIWFGTLGKEWFQLRRSGAKLVMRWRPSGGVASGLAIFWIVVVVVTL